MAGLIDLPTIENPLLKQAEQKVEASVGTGQARADYLKVVNAGMQVGLSKGPDGILAQLDKSQDPVRDCALGAVNLVFHVLPKISRGTLPERAMVPAAATLMFQALAFVDHAGIQAIGKPELDRAAHLFTNAAFQASGITMPMLDHAAGAVRRMTENPQQMAVVQRQLPAPPAGAQGEA